MLLARNTRQHRSRQRPKAERLPRQAVRLLPGIQQTNGFTFTADNPSSRGTPDPGSPGRRASTLLPVQGSSPPPTLPPVAVMKYANGIFPASPAFARRSVLPDGSTG